MANPACWLSRPPASATWPAGRYSASATIASCPACDASCRRSASGAAAARDSSSRPSTSWPCADGPGWLDAPDDAIRHRLLDSLVDDRGFVESVLTSGQLEALDFGYRERV